MAFGNHNGEGDESAGRDFGFAIIKKAVFIGSEVVDEKEGGDTFVAVEEGVIFDNEIEEVGGFFGEGGVDVLASETLVDGAEDTFEGVAAELAEHFSGADGTAELVDELDAETGVERGAGSGFVAETDETFVIFLEGAEGVGVTGDEFEGAISFVAGEVVLSH